MGSFYHFNGVGFDKEINIVVLSNTDLTGMGAFSWDIGKTLFGPERKGNSRAH